MNGKKKFTVTYLPHHKEDKEWVSIHASSKEVVKKTFKLGIILKIEED